MKLFLASEAKHPDTIKHIKQFVGGFDGKRVAYIVTAANGEAWGSWKNSETIKVASTLGATIDVIELENYYKEDTLARISSADIIWMAGGMAGYLMYWIRRVGLDRVLPELLANGKPYIGSSAGSMVCSKTLTTAELYIGDNEPGASLIPGLGFVDFEIYPHFEDQMYEEINSKWSDGMLYLLKNGEAITVVNSVITVIGEKRVLVK